MDDELAIELTDDDFKPREDLPVPKYSRFDAESGSIIINRGYSLDVSSHDVSVVKNEDPKIVKEILAAISPEAIAQRIMANNPIYYDSNRIF